MAFAMHSYQVPENFSFDLKKTISAEDLNSNEKLIVALFYSYITPFSSNPKIEFPELTQWDISESTGLSISCVQRTVSFLVAKGYLCLKYNHTPAGYKSKTTYFPSQKLFELWGV